MANLDCLHYKTTAFTTTSYSGQLIFKYVFSKLFESKRLLKYDTYMES